jgi:hypothetical protein
MEEPYLRVKLLLIPLLAVVSTVGVVLALTSQRYQIPGTD